MTITDSLEDVNRIRQRLPLMSTRRTDMYELRRTYNDRLNLGCVQKQHCIGNHLCTKTVPRNEVCLSGMYASERNGQLRYCQRIYQMMDQGMDADEAMF